MADGDASPKTSGDVNFKMGLDEGAHGLYTNKAEGCEASGSGSNEEGETNFTRLSLKSCLKLVDGAIVEASQGQKKEM